MFSQDNWNTDLSADTSNLVQELGSIAEANTNPSDEPSPCGVTAPVDLEEATTANHNFTLIRASELLAQHFPETPWTWDGILPQGGTSILAAKPKVGKSTLALNLAVAVARGQNFLGRTTAQAPVVYLAFEEKEEQIQKKLKSLKITDEPLYLHVGIAPQDALRQIASLQREKRAGLIIVDTLQKLARLPNLNNYAQVTTTLELLLEIARESNCHILLIHHAGKRDGRDGAEILGSTGLLAGVDTGIILKKKSVGRTFYTVQRYAEDVGETLIQLNDDDSLSLGPTSEEVKDQEILKKIHQVLESSPRSTEDHIVENAGCRKSETARVLRKALAQTPPLLHREGTGKKDRPYLYLVPPLPPDPAREGEK